MTKKQKRGLVILLTPMVLFVGTALLQIVVQFTMASSGSENALRVGINILSLLAGIIAVVGFIPCLIIGIIMLASGGEQQNPSQVHDGTPLPPQTTDSSTE